MGSVTATIASDLRLGLVFLTRLPLPLGAQQRASDLARACWCFPLVGLLVGLLAGGVAILALWCGLTAWLAAVLALAAGLLLTGALHEDGLADMSDGFGGGWTPERRLEIMRDSRLGSYGVLALIVSLLLRAAALAALAGTGWQLLFLSLLAAHAAARAPLPLLMAVMPVARSEGQSVSAGRPRAARAASALVLGLGLLSAASLLMSGHLDFALLTSLLLAMTFLAVWALARRQIGGYTGDVLGGLEQCGEIAALLAAVALFA